jgi:hypothetical protein
LPFLSVPWAVKNRHVTLEVDNISLIFAWEKRYCKNDPETSVIIRCLHVIEAFLECIIHVVHTSRLSTDHAKLADRLSRNSTTTADDRQLLENVKVAIQSNHLEKWLENPWEDWELPQKLVDDITKILYKFS